MSIVTMSTTVAPQRYVATTSGLASATQLVDLTSIPLVSFDRSAAVDPVVIVEFSHQPAIWMRAHLTAEDDPILARLWDNDDDAIYDSM